ncbi:hypothetical protein BDR26DRAFT_206127 [Obelidium mucronatum]|nr:hypothetical protein BDR26DRAFT_206127 [Obelidium mucronatum]
MSLDPLTRAALSRPVPFNVPPVRREDPVISLEPPRRGRPRISRNTLSAEFTGVFDGAGYQPVEILTGPSHAAEPNTIYPQSFDASDAIFHAGYQTTGKQQNQSGFFTGVSGSLEQQKHSRPANIGGSLDAPSTILVASMPQSGNFQTVGDTPMTNTAANQHILNLLQQLTAAQLNQGIGPLDAYQNAINLLKPVLALPPIGPVATQQRNSTIPHPMGSVEPKALDAHPHCSYQRPLPATSKLQRQIPATNPSLVLRPQTTDFHFNNNAIHNLPFPNPTGPSETSTTQPILPLQTPYPVNDFQKQHIRDESMLGFVSRGDLGKQSTPQTKPYPLQRFPQTVYHNPWISEESIPGPVLQHNEQNRLPLQPQNLSTVSPVRFETHEPEHTEALVPDSHSGDSLPVILPQTAAALQSLVSMNVIRESMITQNGFIKSSTFTAFEVISAFPVNLVHSRGIRISPETTIKYLDFHSSTANPTNTGFQIGFKDNVTSERKRNLAAKAANVIKARLACGGRSNYCQSHEKGTNALRSLKNRCPECHVDPLGCPRCRVDGRRPCSMVLLFCVSANDLDNVFIQIKNAHQLPQPHEIQNRPTSSRVIEVVRVLAQGNKKQVAFDVVSQSIKNLPEHLKPTEARVKVLARNAQNRKSTAMKGNPFDSLRQMFKEFPHYIRLLENVPVENKISAEGPMLGVIMTDDSIVAFLMFPEVLGLDSTFGVNENRAPLTLLGCSHPTTNHYYPTGIAISSNISSQTVARFLSVVCDNVEAFCRKALQIEVCNCVTQLEGKV